jgi:uncharacterized protein with FMN-binding domain
VIVRIIESTADEHGPAGSFVVIVNITVPLVISEEEGVYVAFVNDALSKVPVPLLVHVEEADPPAIIPARVYVVPEQMAALAPASAVAAGLIIRVIESATAEQIPAGSFVVAINITLPAVTSVAEGVYVALLNAESSNVPLPVLVHVNDVAPPLTVPANVYVLPEQMMVSDPAATVAAGLIVNIIVSLTAEQGPEGSFDVMIKVTDPAEMSLAEGVYVEFSNEASSNVPLPLLVQLADTEPPAIDPDKIIELPSQIVVSIPALTSAAGLMVNIIESVAIEHGPVGSLVIKDKTTLPLRISAAEGV